MAYQEQGSRITRTTSKIKAVYETFRGLDNAIYGRRFTTDEQALVATIERSINSCKDLILELQIVIEKFSTAPKPRLGAAIKTAGRKLAYPHKESMLLKLDEDIAEIRDSLSFALDVLQPNDCQMAQNDLQDIKSVLELVRASQASKEIREWLKAPDPASNCNDACINRHMASGLWFVKDSDITKWLKADGSFLWLN